MLRAPARFVSILSIILICAGLPAVPCVAIAQMAPNLNLPPAPPAPAPTPSTQPLPPTAEPTASPTPARTPPRSIMPARTAAPASTPSVVSTPPPTPALPSISTPAATPPPALAAPLPAATPRGEPTFDEKFRDMMVVANAFRTNAGIDPNMAMRTFGTESFQLRWTRSIDPYFRNEWVYIQDFFNESLFFGGRSDGERAVAIFYNPWTDIAFLAEVLRATQQLNNFFFIPGERLRGTEVLTNVLEPAWQRIPASLPDAIGPIFAETKASIDELFPPASPFILIPPRLNSRMAPQSAELVSIKSRMIAWNTARNAWENTMDPLVVRMRQDLQSLSQALALSDRAAFNARISSQQNEQMTDLIFEWPQQERERLRISYLRASPDGGHATLIDSNSPAWFLHISFARGVDGLPHIQEVRLFKFDLMARLYSASAR